MGHKTQNYGEFCQSHRLSSGVSEDMLRKKTILIHHIPLCNSTHSETGADCFPTVKPDQTLLRLWTSSECSWILSGSEISMRARASLLLWCRNRRKQTERKGKKVCFQEYSSEQKIEPCVGQSVPPNSWLSAAPAGPKKSMCEELEGRGGSWGLTRVQYY